MLPRIEFAPDAERCPACDGDLTVQKTRVRTVVTLGEGKFEARESIAECDGAGCPDLGAEGLRQLVPPRQRYGYDLIVHVGLSRYIGGRQREEIRAELRDGHGIELSDGTVTNLCDRFLVALERLHLERAPALRAAMVGGYPLHLDATCEQGRGGLFVLMDGWRGWVLNAARIPTEHPDHLQPVVDETVALFGDPVATVRDLGSAMHAAVERLRRRGIPDLACHYHFLAAVGTKLLKDPYGSLREAIRRSGVRSDLHALLRELRKQRQPEGHESRSGVREELLALVLWVLEGDGRKDPVFPFGLPHLNFVRRCERVAEQAEQWVPSPHTDAERRALQRMRALRAQLCRKRSVAQATALLDERAEPFRELRNILRLTIAELPRGDVRYQQPHLPVIELRRLAAMKAELQRYKEELDQRAGDGSPHAVVQDYLQRYGAHLFGHPARYDDDGHISAVVARTNNVLEHLFGSEKQALRRRLGRAHLARDLQQQPAQAAFVANLRHSSYVRVLCGSLDNLAQAFAQLDSANLADTGALVRDHRHHDLQRRIKQLVEDAATMHRNETGDRKPATTLPDHPPPPSDTEGLAETKLRDECANVFAPPRDPRLPPPGGVLRREWRDVHHEIRVLETCFDYRGERYDNLTAIARLITGRRSISGTKFFRLERRTHRKKKPRKPRPPAFEMGPLAERIRDRLADAGHTAGTIRVYFGHIQRFADHHMRSPDSMGADHVEQYLLHLLDNHPAGRGTYPGNRAALRALYTQVLLRPREVDHIPTRPDDLRRLLVARDPPPEAPVAGVNPSSATVL